MRGSALLNRKCFCCSWLRNPIPRRDWLVSRHYSIGGSQLARGWLNLLETVPQLFSRLLGLLNAVSTRWGRLAGCKQDLWVGVIPADRADWLIDERWILVLLVSRLGLWGVTSVAWVCGEEIGDHFAILLILAETTHFAPVIRHKLDSALTPWVELGLLRLVQWCGCLLRIDKWEVGRSGVRGHNGLLKVFLGGRWYFCR